MSNRTLLLIDVQRNMLLPPQPVPDAPAVGPKIAEILERARRAGAMVIHVRNNGGKDDPDAPGTPGWELIHDVAEHDAVVDKRTPNGFAGTELGSLLADAHDVVIVGMQSEYCVRETSLAALQRGLAVLLVRGAHATYGDGKRTAAEIATATDAELAHAGARVLDADDILSESRATSPGVHPEQSLASPTAERHGDVTKSDGLAVRAMRRRKTRARFLAWDVKTTVAWTASTACATWQRSASPSWLRSDTAA